MHFRHCLLHSRRYHHTAHFLQHHQFRREVRRNFHTRAGAVEPKRVIVMTQDQAQLVRDFIQDSLYNPQYGYFNSKDELIFGGNSKNDEDGTLPIDFGSLDGEHSYKEMLSSLYARGRDSWSTPCEIFQPHYAHAIANHIVKTHCVNAGHHLRIVEAGGGNGTCALNILDYLQSHHPALYERMDYRVVDISTTLHHIQKKRLAKHIENGRCTVVNCSILDYWRNRDDSDIVDEREVFVVLNEVIDNFPHDRVIIEGDQIAEVHVVPTRKTDDGTQLYNEIRVTVQDPWITRFLELTNIIEVDNDSASTESSAPVCRFDSERFNFYDDIQDLRNRSNFVLRLWQRSIESAKPFMRDFLGGHSIVWIPTTQLMLLDTLAKHVPNHRLVVADFDSLPSNERGVQNSPIVQFKAADASGERYLTHKVNTYLVPKGSCDIFFPTDFSTMQQVYQKITGGRGSIVMKQSRFLQENLDAESLQKLECRDGYNPALSDYRNMSFLLS